MRLSELIAPFEEGLEGDVKADVDITGITVDSRDVKRGDMFAAIKGEHFDGADYIGEAEKAGASCALTATRAEGVGIPQVIVKDVKDVSRVLGPISARFYGAPSAGGRLKVTGITGTNGKTTVAYLLSSMLRAAGRPSGLIGTIIYRYPGFECPAPLTTPGAPTLQGLLREMADSGATDCVMEVSSHALAQHRVDGTRFGVRVFTNLSTEHMDFHGDMEEYFEAKSRLFGDLAIGIKGAEGAEGVLATNVLKMNVLNMDDEWGRRLVTLCGGRAITYSMDLSVGADIYPEISLISLSGIEAKLETPSGAVVISSGLIGAHNLQNIMAAVGAACALGLDAQSMAEGISALKNVPGRLEQSPVKGPESGAGFTAFVDYAHTPDALSRTLETLSGLKQGRLITVFGCGGDRDQSKRAPMGEVAATLSELSIVTSDNPRGEDPLKIINDVESGMGGAQRCDGGEFEADGLKAGANKNKYAVIPDRGSAIEAAVAVAKAGDIVLVAGKGHEDYQIIKGKRLHFDDREALSKAMEKRSEGAS